MPKFPFGGRGGPKERQPRQDVRLTPEPAADPYASVVAFYSQKKDPMLEVERQLAQQYPDQAVRDSIIKRITEGRDALEAKRNGPIR